MLKKLGSVFKNPLLKTSSVSDNWGLKASPSFGT